MPISRPITKKAPAGFHQNSLLNPSEIENFNNSIPFDPLSPEITYMIPVFIEPLSAYTYCDIYFNPPYSYNRQTKDLLAEFQALTPSNINNLCKF